VPAISRNRKVPSVVRGRVDLDQDTHDKVKNLLKIQSSSFLNERSSRQTVAADRRDRKNAALRPTPAQRALLPQTAEERLDEEDQSVILGDETVNPAAEELLVRVFASWCSFGDRLNTTMLSAAKWEKLLYECGLRPASQRSAFHRKLHPYGVLQAAEAGVIWCKVSAALGQPRLRFSGFLKALRIVALRVAHEEPFEEFVMGVFGPLAESNHLAAPDEDPCAPGEVDDEEVQSFLATRMEACQILHQYFTPHAFLAGRARRAGSESRQSSVDPARDRASTTSKPGSTVSTTAESDAWAPPKGVLTPSPSVMSHGSRGRSSSARRRQQSGLPLDAFQAFVRLTAPADLFTAGQVRAIFQASLEERGDGVERWGGHEMISLNAFPNALARLRWLRTP
jgi:hypothetical protein